MARKFLYLVAALIVLVLGVLLALQFWSNELTRLAITPTVPFQSQPAIAPHAYESPAMWLSRPDIGAQDPARWLPDGLTPETKPLAAAVFFIHPTSYLERAQWNAPLDDPRSQKVARTFVRGMASAFNASTEIWAPQYRQASFGAFLSPDNPPAQQALELAYGDLLQAFDYFLTETAANRSIVLVGHSQGAFHLRRLLRERVAGKPLARRIAAAYVVGWTVSIDHDLPAMGLPACEEPAQAGCVLSWLSFAEPANPKLFADAYARQTGLDGVKLDKSPFLCSNPLTGGMGGSAPASANLGTLVPEDGLATARLVPALVAARCGADGFLNIGPAPDLGPYVLPGNNYHVYDIPLFWANIRADVARRVAAWKP